MAKSYWDITAARVRRSMAEKQSMIDASVGVVTPQKAIPVSFHDLEILLKGPPAKKEKANGRTLPKEG